jgi:hypothetical protein
MLMRSRPRQIALWLSVSVVVVAAPALAADTGNGSKNFSVPSSVPNYFSNEVGPMLGPAAESRRGVLYQGQTAEAPRAAASAVTTAPPRERQHIAMAEPRGRLIRGRRGAPVVARHVAVHGRAVTRVAAHGSNQVHSAHVAVSTHTVSKTRIGSSHRRARG